MLTIDVLIEDVLDNLADDEFHDVVWGYLNCIQADMDKRELYLCLLEGVPCLVKITQTSFVELLEKWYAYNGLSIDTHVRGYKRASSGSFYMMHGLNYDWKDADLFGGSGSGLEKRKFDEFAAECGVEFNYIYD